MHRNNCFSLYFAETNMVQFDILLISRNHDDEQRQTCFIFKFSQQFLFGWWSRLMYDKYLKYYNSQWFVLSSFHDSCMETFSKLYCKYTRKGHYKTPRSIQVLSYEGRFRLGPLLTRVHGSPTAPVLSESGLLL